MLVIDNIDSMDYGDITGELKLKNKSIIRSFDKYDIKLMLDENNRFIDIEEVRVNKNFIESKHIQSSSFDYRQYYMD